MDEKKQIRKRRLKSISYSGNGCYFLTFNTYQNRLMFGSIEMLGNESDHFADMILNENGRCVTAAIERACGLFPQIRLDCCVVMPNHVHLVILLINDGHEVDEKRVPTVSRFVSAIKSHASRLIHVRQPGAKVWSQNYYDRVVRDEEELQRIREYVANNPAKWADEKYFR